MSDIHYRSGRPNYGCTSPRARKEGHERDSAGICALCGDGPGAPVSAPLDTQELPPLPDFMRRDIVRAIEEAVRPKGMSVHDGKARIGGDRLQRLLLIADQYAERIRHLERELAERKPASIEHDADFCALLEAYADAAYGQGAGMRGADNSATYRRAALIAYIDGHTAGTAPADPMDWPLPCDITVGNGTIKRGCKLRSLVARMESLHRMAIAALPKLTPEQQQANLQELIAAADPSSMSKGKEEAND